MVSWLTTLKFQCRFCVPLIDSYRDGTVSEGGNPNRILTAPSGMEEDEEEPIIKWRISKSHKGAHLLKKLFSLFIKEIVEGMMGYVRLPTIMSKLLSDNGSSEFGDFKLTILGMLGTYGFERRILVYIPAGFIFCCRSDQIHNLLKFCH